MTHKRYVALVRTVRDYLVDLVITLVPLPPYLASNAWKLHHIDLSPRTAGKSLRGMAMKNCAAKPKLCQSL